MEWGEDGKAAPMVLMQQGQGRDVGGAALRSFMSLALLVVMLLAFGAAIFAWNKKTQLDTLLEREQKSISKEAADVVRYRDDLATVRGDIEVDLKPRPAPEAPVWQKQIDLLVRENNDLRWSIEQLRLAEAEAKKREVVRRNPAAPGNPLPP